MSTTRDEVFGCELWTGRVDKNGYGYHGRSRAHIVAWEAVNGPRPVGKDGVMLELDHLCRRPSCCAPHHLEAVTPRENLLRRSWSYRAHRKLCAKGHSMHDAMVTPEMGRLCRGCHRAALAEHRGPLGQDITEGAGRGMR